MVGRRSCLFDDGICWINKRSQQQLTLKFFFPLIPIFQSSFPLFLSFSFTQFLTFLSYRTLTFYIGYSCAGLACVSSIFELSYHTSWQNINLQPSHRPKKEERWREEILIKLEVPSWCFQAVKNDGGSGSVTEKEYFIFFSPVHFSCFLTFRMKSSSSVLSR